MSSIPAARPASVRPQSSAPAPTALGLAPIDPLKVLRRYKWWLAGSIVVGGIAGIVAHKAIEFAYPSWRTEVVYQCLSVQQDPTKTQYPMQDKDEMERFLLTQATVINSDRVMRAALSENRSVFEQDTKWGRRWTVDDDGKVEIPRGLKHLKKIANASVVYGTNLVRLNVTTQNPDDSAAIARAIHDAYWKDWRSLSSNIGIEARGPLERRETDLLAEIQRIDAKRDQMMVNYGIDDLRSVRGPAVDRQIDEATRKLADATAVRENGASLMRNYDEIAKKPNTYPDEMIDIVERDQVVTELKAQVAGARSNFASLEKFGADHQRKVSAKQALDALEAELASTRETQLRKIFEGEMDRIRKQVDSANSQITQFTDQYNKAVTRKQEIARILSQFDQLDKDRDRVQAQLAEAQNALTAIRLTVNVTAQDRIDRIRILTPPQAPDTIYFPKLEVMVPLGIVAVFGLTAGILFLRELLDQRVKGPADINSIPRTRLVGGIPSADADPTRPTPETALRDAPTGALADAYRQARSTIAKRMAVNGHKSLLVFSGMPGSGATSAAANIALGAAAAEQRVLLIDANFRRPNLHRVFKLAEGPGLAEVLAKKTPLDQALQATNTPNLQLLAAGTAANRATPERLSTDMMSQVLADAASRYDLIVIDTAPAAIAGDAMALAARVDASLLVVKALGEKRGLIARLKDTFADARAEFMGVLVNNVPPMGTGYMAKNIKAAQEYQSTAG